MKKENKKSQINIHKEDFSGCSLPVEAHLDILLSDLREQIIKIAEAKSNTERNLRISMTGEYLRGYRDGNRFNKPNSYKKLN